MSKPKNTVPSVTVSFTTTPKVKALLRQLVETGLYGKNSSEAAERLVARALEEMVGRGVLHPTGLEPTEPDVPRSSRGSLAVPRPGQGE